MKAGTRQDLVIFQRYEMTENSFGEPVKSDTPTVIGEEWAQVMFGSGKELREAARESASQSATFHVRNSSVTRALTPSDEISFKGLWDITEAVEFSRDEVRIAATKRTT